MSSNEMKNKVRQVYKLHNFNRVSSNFRAHLSTEGQQQQ